MKMYSYGGKANLIGRRVREARLRRGLTQDELAAKMQLENIEISQKGISRLERQQRFVSDFELWALAGILNVELDWFFENLKEENSK